MIQEIIDEFMSRCISNAQDKEQIYVNIRQWIVGNFELIQPFFIEQNKQAFLNIFSEPGLFIPRQPVEIWDEIAGCGENKGAYMDIFGTIFGSVSLIEEGVPLAGDEFDPIIPE